MINHMKIIAQHYAIYLSRAGLFLFTVVLVEPQPYLCSLYTVDNVSPGNLPQNLFDSESNTSFEIEDYGFLLSTENISMSPHGLN